MTDKFEMQRIYPPGRKGPTKSAVDSPIRQPAPLIRGLLPAAEPPAPDMAAAPAAPAPQTEPSPEPGQKNAGGKFVYAFTDIPRLRFARGWSQKELAKIAKLDQGQLSRLENGKVSSPKMNNVMKLCAALGLAPNQFLSGYSNAPQKTTHFILPLLRQNEFLSQFNTPDAVRTLRKELSEPSNTDSTVTVLVQMGFNELLEHLALEFTGQPSAQLGQIYLNLIEHGMPPEEAKAIVSSGISAAV